MTLNNTINSFPFLDMTDGTYYYSKELYFSVCTKHGYPYDNYQPTIHEMYWGLIPLFGKDWKSHPLIYHSQVIEEIRNIGEKIEIQIPEGFGMNFQFTLKRWDENMLYYLSHYEEFIEKNKKEIKTYSIEYIENTLRKIKESEEKLIFLYELSSEYDKYRIKVKKPTYPIKEMFDFGDFEKFKAYLGIEIQRLENTIPLKIKDNSKSSFGKLTKFKKGNLNSIISFNEKYKLDIYTNLENFFDENNRPYLLDLLKGKEIPNKITFTKAGNQLSDIFKQLYHLNVVITKGSKKDLEKWIASNFKYHDLRKNNKITDFTKDVLNRQVSGRYNDCKNPLFKISIQENSKLYFEPLDFKQKEDKFQ